MAIRELVELASRVAELERRFSGTLRHGTIEEVDAAKQIVRLNFGQDEDGKPFLSPWVPYAQIAGALKVHTPPSKGQQFTVLSPVRGNCMSFWMASIAPGPCMATLPRPVRGASMPMPTLTGC